MASVAAIQVLVQSNFDEPCENHNGRPKCILGLDSCDTICGRCFRDEPTIKVVKFNDKNAVWVDEIEGFVDCSLIKGKQVEDRMLILLKANHQQDTCRENNYCSLACKVQKRVKKKRSGGRIRGHAGIFHLFFRLFLMTKKGRSGGRIRRRYDRHLPPKKRNRRA